MTYCFRLTDVIRSVHRMPGCTQCLRNGAVSMGQRNTLLDPSTCRSSQGESWSRGLIQKNTTLCRSD